MKKGYKIDFSANTVIINKNFEQAAQCLNTPEFKLCREFREMGLTISNSLIATICSQAMTEALDEILK